MSYANYNTKTQPKAKSQKPKAKAKSESQKPKAKAKSQKLKAKSQSQKQIRDFSSKMRQIARKTAPDWKKN